MTETAIVHKHLEWLAKRHIFAWRNNTGSYEIQGRWICYGHPGSSDILAVLAGKLVCIECKTLRGRQSKEQKLFQRMVERAGAIYILSRSTEELERRLYEIPRLAAALLHV